MKHSSLPTRLMLVVCALNLPAAGPAANANPQLAADMGCYNCHGSPKLQHAPSMARLAEHAAKHRGDEAAIQKRADKLRAKSLLHPIAAHEKLSPEMAVTLMRWLSEDGPH